MIELCGLTTREGLDARAIVGFAHHLGLGLGARVRRTVAELQGDVIGDYLWVVRREAADESLAVVGMEQPAEGPSCTVCFVHVTGLVETADRMCAPGLPSCRAAGR